MKITSSEHASIRRAVNHYEKNRHHFENAAETVHNYFQKDEALASLIHSIKYRTKGPEQLKDKLQRKAKRSIADGKRPEITPENLFERVGDLAGVRLLHLHPRQIVGIIPEVKRVLQEYNCPIVEGPFAYTWDDETRELFEGAGIDVDYKPELYTSVHLVVKFNTKYHWQCEIQIRTLMEEVWGEVSHMLNYPHPTKSIACGEQLRVLARVASGATRLVDSIFASVDEHSILMNKRKPK